MQTAQPSIFARDDTFFGVCEALGEDLGINSNLIRVGFAVGVFFSPIGAVAAYVGAALVVAISRLIVRNPRIAATEPVAAAAADPVQAAAEAVVDNDNTEALPVAA